jgi:hypothetical protein
MEKYLKKFRVLCNRNSLWLPGLAIMLAVAVIGLGAAVSPQTSRETIIEFCVLRALVLKVVGMPHTECPWLAPRKEMVEMTEFSWDRSGFSHMSLDFTVRNNNDYAVKDITIYCYHRAPSGTVIDDNTRTLYERIPAHGTISRREFPMGFIHEQVVKSACYVSNYLPA